MGFIYILEFGGQHADLIGNRLKEMGFADSVRYANSDVRIDQLENPAGIIISGGPKNLTDGAAPKYDPRLFDPSAHNIPVFGICYGMQLLAHNLGASLHRRTREYGETRTYFNSNDVLLDGLGPVEITLMNHGDSISGEGDYTVMGYTEKGVPAAIRANAGRYAGVQFHPECTHTTNGGLMLTNFVEKECGITPQGRPGFDVDRFITNAILRLKDEVGNDTGFLYASGGVDSTVVAALAREAGIKVKPIHIDAGNERKNEAQYAKMMFRDQFGMDLYILDRSEQFLAGLEGIERSKPKRSAFRQMYNDTNAYLERQFDVSNTVQLSGDLATDLRESGQEAGKGVQVDTGTVEQIKEHHNSGKWPGRKVAPLEGLTKQHARIIARHMGLPPEVSERCPFPGPGIFVRYTNAYYDVPKDLFYQAGQMAHRHGMEAFVLPRKAVGVKGDQRADEHAVVITGEPNWGNIRRAAKCLIEDLAICRVVYTPHFNFSESHINQAANYPLNRRNLDRLRDVTEIAEQTTHDFGVKYAQMPVISFGGPYGWMNVIRDVHSQDFRTLRPLIKPDEFPWECYGEIKRRLAERLGDDAGITALDVSDKPGGSTEWE